MKRGVLLALVIAVAAMLSAVPAVAEDYPPSPCKTGDQIQIDRSVSTLLHVRLCVGIGNGMAKLQLNGQDIALSSPLTAGTREFTVTLPQGVKAGNYTLVLDGTSEAGTAVHSEAPVYIDPDAKLSASKPLSSTNTSSRMPMSVGILGAIALAGVAGAVGFTTFARARH